jgi:hypothetical protein
MISLHANEPHRGEDGGTAKCRCSNFYFFSLQYCINTFPKSVQHIKYSVGYESTTVMPAALRPFAEGAIKKGFQKLRTGKNLFYFVSFLSNCHLIYLQQTNTCSLLP